LIDELVYLLFVFEKLVVYAFPQAHCVVVYSIVVAGEFLKADDVLVTALFGLGEGLL
jgi:hypothetical protein